MEICNESSSPWDHNLAMMNLKGKSVSISGIIVVARSYLHKLLLKHIKSTTTIKYFTVSFQIFFFGILFMYVNYIFPFCVLSLGDSKILQIWEKKKGLVRQRWPMARVPSTMYRFCSFLSKILKIYVYCCVWFPRKLKKRKWHLRCC